MGAPYETFIFHAMCHQCMSYIPRRSSSILQALLNKVLQTSVGSGRMDQLRDALCSLTAAPQGASKKPLKAHFIDRPGFVHYTEVCKAWALDLCM